MFPDSRNPRSVVDYVAAKVDAEYLEALEEELEVDQKLPELGEKPRTPTFNYDTGERYLSVPDFLPEQ